MFAFFFHKIIFLCTKVPGWLEKCWLSAQSSGLEGAGRTHRCEGGPAGEKQGEDRLRQGAQEDAGSDTPVRGAGQEVCVSPQAGEGSHSGTLEGMGGPVAVPLPQPSCRGWRGRKAALGPVWRKAPQLQPRRRTAHDGEGDSSHGTFLKRAAGRSCRRGKGTCGRWQRRREGPSPGRSARSAPSVTKGAPRASAVMRAGLLDP